MWHVVLAAVLCIQFGVLPAAATPAPQEILSAILSGEFSGDGGARIQKVIHSSHAARVPEDCGCSMPDDWFDPEYSPITIISEWHFVSETFLSQKIVSIVIESTKLAIADGEGDPSQGVNARTIKPLSIPTIDNVEYRLARVDSGWMLLDPPMPRVGLHALINKMSLEAVTADDRLKHQEAAGLDTKKPRLANNWRRGQLAILQLLDHDGGSIPP